MGIVWMCLWSLPKEDFLWPFGTIKHILSYLRFLSFHCSLPRPGWTAPLWTTWSWPSGTWTLAGPSAFAPPSGTPRRSPGPCWSRHSRPRWRWTPPAWGRKRRSPPPSRYRPPWGRPTCLPPVRLRKSESRKAANGMLEPQGSEWTLILSIPVAWTDLTSVLFIGTALHVKAANSLGGMNWLRTLNRHLVSYIFCNIKCLVKSE